MIEFSAAGFVLAIWGPNNWNSGFSEMRRKPADYFGKCKFELNLDGRIVIQMEIISGSGKTFCVSYNNLSLIYIIYVL